MTAAVAPAHSLLLAPRPLSFLRAALDVVLHGHFRAVGRVPFLGRELVLRAPILTEPLSTGALTGLTLFLGRVCAAALVVGHASS